MAISKIIYKASPQDTGTVWMDATPATAEAGDITAPKTAMLSNGILTTGTGSGGGTPEMQELLEKYTTYGQIPADSSVSGYLLTDGTIDTGVSGGVINKYLLPSGTTEIILNGISELYIPSSYAVYWFVSNDTMLSYYAPASNPELFINKSVEIPTGATELWSTEVVPFVMGKLIEPAGSQWKNKRWYAYGTSITDTSTTGKYPAYLAQMSGLKFYNKGIAGGGIGNLGGYSTGQVYSAICNTIDGKLQADLITLETGANDDGAGVPLGTVYDTGTSTLAGCLNDCLRYLQTNTDAQIVVTYSPASTTAPNVTDKYYEWQEMVERICRINRVYYIKPANGMGYAKLTSSKGSLYVDDNIHQTRLGGYIMAENIWNQLKNIPLFYTKIPDGQEDDPSVVWETVYSGSVNLSGSWGDGTYYAMISSWTESIDQNSVWRITWDNVQYECTATWEGSQDGSPYAIGNYTYDGGSGGTEFPFFMQRYYGTSLAVVGARGSHSLKMERQVIE